MLLWRKVKGEQEERRMWELVLELVRNMRKDCLKVKSHLPHVHGSSLKRA